MFEKAYYSIIQYCPEPSRGESANIGVALYCPNLKYIKAQVAAGNDKIRRFFGSELDLDLVRINASKKAVNEYLANNSRFIKNVDDFSNLTRNMANEFTFTELRPCKIENPDLELENLFIDLVGGRAKKEAIAEPQFPEVEKIFRSKTLEKRILFNHKLTIPIAQKVITIPYAYQNGNLNLVKPEKFTSRKGLDTAFIIATEDRIIRESNGSGPKKQLIVIPYFDEVDNDFERKIFGVMDKCNVRTITRSGLIDFAGEVERDAKEIIDES